LSAEDGGSESSRLCLLGDLRVLFCLKASGVLFTNDILPALQGDETRPWSEWKNGKAITAVQLSTLLREFNIKPKTVRRGGETEKGYKLEWFEDAFARYLSPRPVTPSQWSGPAAIEPTRAVTAPVPLVTDVTDELLENTSISAGCDDVTDRTRLLWKERV
jgi:putative DNA primase/helicase